MGVLHIKDNVDELLAKDPYELFTLDEPQQKLRSLRPQFWGAAAIGVLLAFGIAFMTFYGSVREARDGGAAGEAPYAYFEIKAIDQDGRPVTGATVRQGEKQLGVTDSFGEWRRFMRVRLGATVLLTISKRAGAVQLSAVKNIAVPTHLPASGDLEVRGSVALHASSVNHKTALPTAAETTTDATRRTEESAAAPAVPARESAPVALLTTATGGVEEPGKGQSESLHTSVSTATVATTLPVEASPSTADADGNITYVSAASDTSGQAAPALDYSSVWFASDAATSAPVSEVINALRQRSRELGLRLDPQSSWQVRLTDLAWGNPEPVPTARAGSSAAGDVQRLLKVDAYASGSTTPQFSYLRNFGDTPLQTARDVLWSMSMHVEKPHEVTRRGTSWYVNPSKPKLWALSSGKSVVDPYGVTFNIETGEVPGSLRLATGAAAPCRGAATCTVSTLGIRRQPPVAGWRRLQLRILGAETPGTVVYVSGYSVRQLGPKLYEYWGVPQMAANITAVRNAKLLQRGKLPVVGAGSLPVLTLPLLPLSQR